MKKQLLVAILLGLVQISYGQIDLTNYNQLKFIGKQIEVLEDKTNTLTIHDVQQSTHFTKCKDDVPNFFLTTSTIWVRMAILPNLTQDKYLLDVQAPLLDICNLYEQDSFGKVLQIKAGDNLPYQKRKYDFANFLFNIDNKSNTTKYYYLQTTNHEQFNLPMQLGKAANVIQSSNNDFISAVIFITILLVMFLYNLFIYISVLDKTYLIYVGYLFFVGFTQIALRGFGYKLLWSNNVLFQAQSTYIFSAFTGIFSILFFQIFIGKQNIPKIINLLVKIVLFGYSAVFVLLVFKQYQIGYMFLQIFAMLAICLSLSAGFIAIRKNIPAAKFYLIAWIAFILGLLLFIFKDIGLIPYSFLTINALPIGAVLEAILLSFALANRIKLLQQEKTASQLQLLENAKVHEHMLNEKNKELDSLVKVRTQKLEQTLTDLKRSEVEMVNKEKMSSLGVLTAGIAHEINNPINFVTSSITPLKRDIKEVLDYFQSNNLPKDTSTEAMDLPFLIEEINMLLNGIEEGAIRTAVIIKGLQKFSRSDNNEKSQSDVLDGLENTIILLNNKIQGHITLIKQYDTLPLLNCNISKLNQVFLNVLANAIHAVMHNGKLNKQVEITAQLTNNNIEISFIDNGIGMNDEVQSKIFDPFYTTKDVGQGTGLGMSISLGLVQDHNGQIQVTSAINKGTCVKIILPI